MLTHYILSNYPFSEAIAPLQFVYALYYGLIAAGGFLCWVLIFQRLRSFGYNSKRTSIFMFTMGITGLIAVFLGSKIPRMFYISMNKWNFGLFFDKIVNGRIETFHGSLIFLFIATIIVIYIYRRFGYSEFNYTEILDTGALYMPLHIFFGRTGCFLSKCCWGKTGQIDVGDAIYQFDHPAPFYEMLFGIFVFLILRYFYNKIYYIDKFKKYSGIILSLSALLYGFFRYNMEYIRNEPVVAWGLTQAQIIMIFLMLFGASSLIWVFMRKFRFGVS